MSEQTEHEWTDKFGTHWEVRQVGPDGAVHAVRHTWTIAGWPNRDLARTAVARAATAPVR